MSRRLALVLGFVAVAVAAAAAVWIYDFRPGRAAHPNILLISIDSLRADHLSCYGYGRKTSPTLDRLAAEGALFEHAISTTSWTLPAHAAMFTGLQDSVHGCTDGGRWLAKNRTTLAEVLRDEGYATAGFFSGPYLHAAYGLAQGFDSYEDCSTSGAEALRAKTVNEALDQVHRSAIADVTNPGILEKVTGWLGAASSRPFFMFVHMWDVHFDYIPPKPYDTMFGAPYDGPIDGRDVFALKKRKSPLTGADLDRLVALYDGEIRWTDETIAKILAALEKLGRLDNTIVVVTADHGEAFYEHGTLTHRNGLHAEEVHVPLIIRYPKGVKAGLRVQRPVSLTDLAPTVLELAGAPSLPIASGASRAPALGFSTPGSSAPGVSTPGAAARRGEAPEGDPAPVVSELLVPQFGQNLTALTTANWKMIIDFAAGSHEVFDKGRDPAEQRPLAEKDYPRPAEELKQHYQRLSRALQIQARKLPRPKDRDTPTIPAMLDEQLRSLGYLK